MRLSIVEDEPVLLEKLKHILDGENFWTVVGTFGSAEDAIDQLGITLPDVMLIDIGLPGMSGIELSRRVKKMMPEVELVVFTGMEDRSTILSAIRAGASGYILKGSTPRELIEALQTLCNGGAPMSPRISRALVRELQEGHVEDQNLLSRREKEIMQRVEQELSYKEIAEQLFISHHTVHTHIKNIYDKLQAKGRKDALVKAKRRGLV